MDNVKKSSNTTDEYSHIIKSAFVVREQLSNKLFTTTISTLTTNSYCNWPHEIQFHLHWRTY